MDRRRFLKNSLAGAVGAMSGMPLSAGAQPTRSFIYCSWGGALQEMEKKAFIEPFFLQKGITFNETSPTTYAKLKAQVEAKAVEWDLVTVGGQWLYQGGKEGLLEEIDYNIVRADHLGASWKAKNGVYSSTGSTVIAFNTDSLPAGKAPKTWADFWDVKKFPGQRSMYSRMYYNYEAALRAAGVPADQLYPATEEKVRLMFQKMEEIKPHVTVWWTSGAQPLQLLATGEVSAAMAWSGRVADAQKGGAPVDMIFNDGIVWGNVFVVPKGSPYKNLAMEAINYVISEKAQDRLLDLGVYAPVLEASAKRANAEQARLLVTHPDNLKGAIIFNDEESAGYIAKYERDWQKFQLQK